MEADLRTLILTAADRVAWGARPQGSALPAVVLYRVGGPKHYNLVGESGPFQVRVQVNCMDTSYLGAMNTCRAVAAVLSGYSGAVGSTYFQGILQDGEPRSLDEPDGVSEQRVFGQTIDFLVSYTPQE